MTESTSSSQSTPASASRPVGQPASSQPRHSGVDSDSGGATPDVFGDGSTREQQEQQIKAAEEVNKSIKEAGDAERKAREG